jgi:NAD(P)-dependent dehydrogenase (short-subunit alcohol dehydrogenase family)
MPTALVTGAGKGIGRGIARRLRSDGYDVAVADIDLAAAETTAGEIEGRALQCDVSDPDAVAAMAEQFDGLDVLVNNAGIYTFGPLTAMPVSDYRTVTDVNMLGTILCTQALQSALAARRGAVVNLASLSATTPVPGTGIYSATKAAIVSITQLFALELAPAGIRVNAVAPGRIATEGTASRQQDAEKEARTAALIPLGRVGIPEDVAGAVSFLAGPDASYITGQTLCIDGGITIATMEFYDRARR